MKKLAGWLARRLLGKSHRTAFDAAAVKSVLIIRHDRIGDMIVTTPLFRELKKAYPHLQIDVVASSANQAVIRHNPHIRDIIVWDKQGACNDIDKVWQIRRRRYDVIFNTMNIFSLPYLMRIKLLGARFLIGFNVEKYQTSTRHLRMFDHTVDCVRSRPILESYFSACGPFGMKDVDYRYELFGVDAYAAEARRFVDDLRLRHDGFLCFNFQGSSASRTFRGEDAVAFCRAMADKYAGSAIVVLYPPGGREEAQRIVVAAGRINVVLSFATENVLQLAALIRECDAVISPDTAVIHLASVYNKKILGFYVNSDNHHWFHPRSERFRVLLAETESIGALNAPMAMSALDDLLSA